MPRRAVFVLLLLCVLPAAGQGQPSLVEHGVFNLHKFEQLIGRETYTFTQDAARVPLNSDFKFTDRGTEVPLKATLTMADDLTPRDFQIRKVRLVFTDSQLPEPAFLWKAVGFQP